jgi:hypothetical protein
MTVKEYLHQAYRLDQKIKSDTMEVQNLRVMAGSRSAGIWVLNFAGTAMCLNSLTNPQYPYAKR